MGLRKTLRVFTLYSPRRFKNLLSVVLCLLAFTSSGQGVVKEFQTDTVYSHDCAKEGYKHKTIPSIYCHIINAALAYYPELTDTRIVFKIKKQKSPLTAKPSFGALFRSASRRKYVITISNKTDVNFTPIQLRNLSLNAQIGVIGHELGHISDYRRRSGLYFIGMGIGSLSSKVTDRREYATDMRCIAHGLGYQLLAWSIEVRSKLDIRQWKGVKEVDYGERERYMNPQSIRNAIAGNKIYN
jgi:hypothetical protein